MQTHQNFEAARCYKTRKENITAAYTNLTAVKTTRADVKSNRMFKFHKVRIPTEYKGHKVQIHKVQIPTKYKGHKVQMPSTRKYKFHKVQITCVRRVTSNPKVLDLQYKDNPEATVHAKPHYKTKAHESRMPHQNKHTSYGPYNIPHMVLGTKQGPDNA